MISPETLFGLDIVTARIADVSAAALLPLSFHFHQKISNFRRARQESSNLHQVFHEPFVAIAVHQFHIRPKPYPMKFISISARYLIPKISQHNPMFLTERS